MEVELTQCQASKNACKHGGGAPGVDSVNDLEGRRKRLYDAVLVVRQHAAREVEGVAILVRHALDALPQLHLLALERRARRAAKSSAHRQSDKTVTLVFEKLVQHMEAAKTRHSPGRHRMQPAHEAIITDTDSADACVTFSRRRHAAPRLLRCHVKVLHGCWGQSR